MICVRYKIVTNKFDFIEKSSYFFNYLPQLKSSGENLKLKLTYYTGNIFQNVVKITIHISIMKMCVRLWCKFVLCCELIHIFCAVNVVKKL